MSGVPLNLLEDDVRAIAAFDREEFCELVGVVTTSAARGS